MMQDERKHFYQRLVWLIIPGIVSGLITGAIAWGSIRTEVQYMKRDIERNRVTIERVQRNVTELRVETNNVGRD